MTVIDMPGVANLQHPDNIAADQKGEAAAQQQQDGQPKPAARKYAGKYDSPEALEQGYQNSAKEVQNILAREKAKDQEIANLKLALTGRVNPADVAAARRNPVEELTEAMVPVEALGAFVEQAIAKTFEPIARNMQARSSVTKEYKEFGELEEKLNEYLTANPDINERYQAVLATTPEVAMEWLLLRHQRSTGAADAAQADLSGQQQATRRAEAALSGSSVGDRATGPTAGEKLKAASEIAQRTGNIEPALRALVEGGFITHPDLK